MKEPKTIINDGILKANLDTMKKAVKKDNDVLIIVDGKERIGKSVMAMQLGYYLSDENLTLEQVTFTADEFKEAVAKATPYSAVIFDEAYLGLSSRETMSKYNRMLTKLLVTIGQKNLFIILVLPSVFDLSKYAVLHRADCLIHCYKKDGQRGMFTFFNSRKLKQLYVTGKKFYSYAWPKSNFYGRFNKTYFLDEEEYRKKKLSSLNQLLSEEEDMMPSHQTHKLYRAIRFIRELKPELRQQEIADIIQCGRSTIGRALNTRKSTEDQEEDS